MIALTQNLIDEKNKLAGDAGWVELLELRIYETVSASPGVRLAAATQPVTFAGNTYRPFPFTLLDIHYDDEGRLATPRLVCSNATREAAKWLQIGAGFIGRPVTWRLVHESHLGTGDQWAMTFRVTAGATVTNEVVAIPLSLPPFLEASWPQDVFTRDRCVWVYKGGQTCKYIGALATCIKTLAACDEHGADELANNRPPLHPRRFLGFPGLPAPRR